jgi:hypothetical protein
MFSSTHADGRPIWEQSSQHEPPMAAIQAAKAQGIASFWFVPTATQQRLNQSQVEVWERQGKYWSSNPYARF